MAKKLLTLIISLAFLGGASAPVFAAATVSLSPANATVKIGDTLTVTTTINPNGGRAGAAEIDYGYDASLLSFVSFTPGTYSTCVPGSDTAGKISRNCAVLGGTTQSSSFGTISFKALQSGGAKLTVSGQVLDENNNNIFGGSVSGSYTIATSQPVVSQPPKRGEVKAASTSASPTIVPTTNPTISVSFGTTDTNSTQTPTKADSYNSSTLFLVLLVLGLVGYILYSKGVFAKIIRKK